MQSGTSCFNKTIFKKNITHFWPIWGIYLVFLLYALPLTLLLSTENPGTGTKVAKQIMEALRLRLSAPAVFGNMLLHYIIIYFRCQLIITVQLLLRLILHQVPLSELM